MKTPRVVRLACFLLVQTSLIAPASGKELSFSEAVALATQNAPKIKQAEAALRAQNHASTGAWLDLGPRVRAEYTEAHFPKELSVQTAAGPSVVRSEVVKNGGLTLVQPITGLFGL